MITIGEGDILARWRNASEDRYFGLRGWNSTESEIAEPLFKSGADWLQLTRRIGFRRASDKSSGGAHGMIYLLIEGRMEVSIGRRKWIAEPGYIFVTPSGASSRLIALTETASWIQFEVLAPARMWSLLLKGRGFARKCTEAGVLYSLVNSLLLASERYTLEDRRMAPFISEAVLAILKGELLGSRPDTSKHISAVTALGSQIRDEPTKEWSVKKMDRDTGMPMRSLSRHFRVVYGTSPLGLVQRYRLLQASDLLAGTDMPIEDVARKCGYSNGASFSNMFYRHLRVRPAEYRRFETPRRE